MKSSTRTQGFRAPSLLVTAAGIALSFACSSAEEHPGGAGGGAGTQGQTGGASGSGGAATTGSGGSGGNAAGGTGTSGGAGGAAGSGSLAGGAAGTAGSTGRRRLERWKPETAVARAQEPVEQRERAEAAELATARLLRLRAPSWVGPPKAAARPGAVTRRRSWCTSAAELADAIEGTEARVIHVSGSITGSFGIGSNKSVIGICGAEIHGHIGVSNASNVILRNLKMVGNNCSDSPADCSGGADAITIGDGSHHVWVDHLDVSDGSDGNLDITGGANFVTVSWTKFSYSTKRTDPDAGASGHRFSNLIGSSDTDERDPGKLNVTYHHCWWAQNVDQRMPRSRRGRSTSSTTSTRRPATATARTPGRTRSSWFRTTSTPG